MRIMRIARASALYAAACLIGLPNIAAATTYTDATGDAYGDAYVDITSVVVTNDASNLDFVINLNPASAIQNNTNDQYGKYQIGLQTGPGGSTAVANPYGQPIGISTGMNFWVDSWTDDTIGPPDTGGAQLFQYTGSWNQIAGIGTNSPYVDMPVTLTDTSIEISIPLSSVGLSAGNSFNFDVWTTYDNPGGQAAYDALDSGAAATHDPNYMPWNGNPYDSATAVGSTFSSTTYTISAASVPSLSWNNTGGTGDGVTWDTTQQNFNDGTNPAIYADGDAVTFDDTTPNGQYAVHIPNPISPASITVNASGNYTFSGAGSISGSGSLTKMGTGKLTISAPLSYTGATTVSAGELSLLTNLTSTSGISVAASATLQLQPGATINTATLSLASGATIDITTNTETFDTTIAGHDAATLLSDLTSAYDKGTWDGTGITSSIAAASHGITTLGYLVSGNTFTITYTLPGDTDLNGSVNATDLYNLSHGIGWDDFNYDGVINADDYSLFMLGAAYGTPPSISLPEPAISVAMMFGFAGFILRERKQRRY